MLIAIVFIFPRLQRAGFCPPDAPDLNAAINIAEGMPQARIGSIEVRPIKDLSKHVR